MLGRILSSILFLLILRLPLGAQTGTPFSFLAIGDAGAEGEELLGCARQMLEVAKRYERERRPVGMLLFLGDNFYPNGLNHRSQEIRRELIETVIGPHRELMGKLGRANVHAIPGNHDYYCATINHIPYGSCDLGNRYEAEIREWTYHPHYPALLRRAVAEGSRDSADFILFDSALLLTQNTSNWRPVLDSLERMLRRSAGSIGVVWRLIMAHHSPYSIGEHGGYRIWLSDLERVGYLGNCIDDMQDPFKYVEEILSHQDNCTPRYQAYNDSLMKVIERSGAPIQLLMAGHDHSLQLLNYRGRDCANCPSIYVVNGAGSKRSRVKSSSPPYEFTHPFNTSKEKGRSAAGFTICSFEGDRLSITFIDSERGEALEMGGYTKFLIDRSGKLEPVR